MVDSLIVQGGIPLHGSVCIQGSKNAALPMMAAAILHKGITILKNCPQISDVYFMTEILKSLGAQISWDGHTLKIDCRSLHSSCIPSIYGMQMRSTTMLLGSLLGRLHTCEMPYPGGCVIGKRPIDIHIESLQTLNVIIEEKTCMIKAKTSGLTGCAYRFTRKSVGATENMIMASVFAKGNTYLYGCSIEPEVVWLCRFLTSMGAHIRGIGTKNLHIQGVQQLRDTIFEVPSDRIVAGTYLLAGAATRGTVILEHAPYSEMEAILQAYVKMGGQYEYISGKLVTDSTKIAKPLPFVETEVYPGLPTDLQSQLLAVLSAIPGKSILKENVFEDRFKIVSELNGMGADITAIGNEVHINGVSALHGERVYAKELRGGAALVIAALSAQGESHIENYRYIERGYEDICRDLKHMGAMIQKDKDDTVDGERYEK